MSETRPVLAEADAPPPRVRWEYQQIVTTSHAAIDLAGAGIEGWELVAVVPIERVESEETISYDKPGPPEQTTEAVLVSMLLYVFKRPAR
jgi:hypothetical protein